MNKIASFQVDHTNLLPGMYLSRTDGDIITYDLRFIRPNTPPFLENGTLHTIEHLFATYIRNSPLKDGIIYFGPMGCRTGFYLITRGISHADAIDITKKALNFIADYNGDIPGAAEEECGNYLEHNLDDARKKSKIQLEVLENWKDILLDYPT
ncbi:MAG: S-ribosylhomocysteine lyase [Oscillospiraceae bacterium]|nr:S-ribosylhomocysteine lyase [Oscillospiraceae bacterium]MDD4545889.1 S-ribosylhomocysteine lyase [Oscillospiraceae bacterium]